MAKLHVTKLCVTKSCVAKSCVRDKVVCERKRVTRCVCVCVTKVCVCVKEIVMCDTFLWRRRRRRSVWEAGRKTKNKNPIQSWGEKLVAKELYDCMTVLLLAAVRCMGID